MELKDPIQFCALWREQTLPLMTWKDIVVMLTTYREYMGGPALKRITNETGIGRSRLVAWIQQYNQGGYDDACRLARFLKREFYTLDANHRDAFVSLYQINQ